MFKTRNILLMKPKLVRGKQRWSVSQKKKLVTDRALENFDDFYGSVFGTRWNNMRAALLTEKKFIAMVNNFGDTEKTCSSLEMQGGINLKLLINLEMEKRKTEETVPIANEKIYKLDDRLRIVIENQIEQQKQSIYPKSTDKKIDRAHYPIKDNAFDSKDLLQEMEKGNAAINQRRIIDNQYDHGGLYDYVPSTRLKGMEDWIPEFNTKYYKSETDFPLNFEVETELEYPENVNLYTFDMGNCSKFRTPYKCITGVSSHYLMDGASILPPLFLNVQKGDKVLDACAAPGGKSLFFLETMYPDVLVCNDIQESRVNRIRKVMNEFLIDFQGRWEGRRCILTQRDASSLSDYETYDRILVDVPCTADRHSLNENDNNIFKQMRLKERLRLPEVQSGILSNCLRLLKPGGSLVYSTCSLSPIQNDGVVHTALQHVFTEYGITVTIKDLSSLIQLFRSVYKFEEPKGLKYGQMVVPFLPANFGPSYFCKITRN